VAGRWSSRSEEVNDESGLWAARFFIE